MSLDNEGCVGEPHIVVERCFVFPCILHCCMAIGRLQVAFIEARVEQLPKDTAAAVQRQLYQARTGVKLGATVSPHGEESQALFLAWEELGPMLAYAPQDPEWQAMVAMRELLCALCRDTPTTTDLQAAAVARKYRELCCKASCQSNCLLYPEEDVTEALANAAGLGAGLGAVLADVVESLNTILKKVYNDHTARGGGAGGKQRGKGGGGSVEGMGVVVF